MDHRRILEKMIFSNQYDKVTMAKGDQLMEICKKKQLKTLETIIINKDYAQIDTAKGIQEWIQTKGEEIEKDVPAEERNRLTE